MIAPALLLSALAQVGLPPTAPRGYLAAPGFKVEIAADFPAVVNPVTMTFGEDGTLYVIDWTPGDGRNDRIKALRSTRGDGIFDQVTTLLEDLHLPAGLLLDDGWLYLPQDEELWRMRFVNGRPRPETKQVLARGFKNDNSHHRLSGITLGADGWLYLTTGDSDTLGEGSDGSRATIRRSGGVLRTRRDGSGLEVVAMGMRNPFGNVAFDRDLEIFHTDNDNEDGSKFQGCRLLHVVDGGDYGWRLRQGAICCAPDHARGAWSGERPGRLPRLLDTGRGSPAGLAVLESTAFPPSLQGSLIYPDVFRRLVRLYSVRREGATFAVNGETQLLQAEGPDAGLFRPADAEVGPDGALYVLDWRTDAGGAGRTSGDNKHGRIYRITWGGTTQEPARSTRPFGTWAALRTLSDARLVDALGAPDLWDRTYAQRELARRGPAARRLALTAARDPARPATARLLALVAAAQKWDPAVESLCRSLLRGAGREPPALAGAAADLLRRFARRAPPMIDLGDAHLTAAVQRRAAMLVGSKGGTRAVTPLMQILDGKTEDRFARDGAERGLDSLGPPATAALQRWATGPDPRRRKIGLEGLQAMRNPSARRALVDLAGDARLSDDERAALFEALPGTGEAATAARIGEWGAANPRAPAGVKVAALAALRAIAEEHPAATRAPAGALACAWLGDPGPGVQAAAVDLAEALHPPCAVEPLHLLAGNTGAPVAARAQAARALGGFPDPVAVATLRRLAAGDAAEDVRAEALKALARANYEAAAPIALERLGDGASRVRQTAMAVLGQKPAQALALLQRATAGKLGDADLPRVLEAVQRERDPEVQRAVTALLRTRTTMNAMGADDLAQIARRRGNPEQGRSLFLDRQRLACIQCHEIEGTGGKVGPSLTRVYETLTLAKIIESILEPSKEIKEAFQSHNVVLADGRLLAGRLVSQSATEVVLSDAAGQEVRVPRPQISQMLKSDVSLMPDASTSHLTLQEMADLLAFLTNREAQAKLGRR